MASAQTEHAILHQGHPVYIDYLTASAFSAGDLVALPLTFGGLWGVFTYDVASGDTGAIAISGIFRVLLKAATAFVIGAMVEWDDVNKEAEAVGSGDLGLAIAVAASGDDFVLVNLNTNILAGT